ncbi:14128_t:CDS:2 [Cetraspora pellucida]|uniref:14128_t:CDS:1 n=1 Tax=Cetraspora pellucida TaxID=1433469 RepID=A0A9N9FE06_9GLOM|nr:14128_t:CDS:2 [Cetraspora pellucida]
MSIFISYSINTLLPNHSTPLFSLMRSETTSGMSVSSAAAAAMANLASRIAALENELETGDKDTTDNIDLDDYMDSNSQKEKTHLDENIDYYSDLSSPSNGSLDNFSTSTSITSISRHSDLTKSDQNYSQPSGALGHLSSSGSSNYTSRTPSYDVSQSKHNTVLDESLKVQLEKKHAEELEKVRQELEDTRNKHWSELQKSKNDLAEQYKENERIRQELLLKHENEKDLLKKSHQVEKEKIITELATISQLKKQTESDINKIKESFENEKQLILQQHKKEKESLMSEHSTRYSNLSKSHEDVESKINQLISQHEAEKKDLENKLLLVHRSEKDNLLAEIKQNEETQSKLNALQIEHDRTLKELKELTINKDDAKKTISDLERKLSDMSNMEVTSQELRQQLDEANNELSNIRLKLSSQLNEKKNLESELENIQTKLNDSNDKIKNLELQIEIITKEKENNSSKHANEISTLRIEFDNSLKSATEKLQKNHDEEMSELHNSLESAHKTALESLREQMSIQREEQITALQADHDQRIKSLKKEHEEKTMKLESLKKGHEEKTTELESLKKGHEEKITELESLKKEHEEKITEFESLKKEHEEKITEFESLKKEHEEKITEFESLKKEHEKKITEFESLKNEYEEKIAELINKNESLLSENALCIRAIEDATRRYDELNNKHIQYTQENLEMSSDLIDLRKKIEELENKNLYLENDKSTFSNEVGNISQEKEQIIADLNAAKDEKQQLHEEGLSLKSELEELKGERDKLAGVINIMKEEWEKEYQKLKSEKEQAETEWEKQYQKLKSEKEQIEIELNRLKESSNQEKEIIKNRESETQSELNRLKRETKEISEKLKVVENEKNTLSKICEEHQGNMQTLEKNTASERQTWKQKEMVLFQKETEIKDLRQELETFNQKLLELSKEKALTDNKVITLEDEKKRIEVELNKKLDENSRLLDQLFNMGSSSRSDGEDGTSYEALKMRLDDVEIESSMKDSQICELEIIKQKLQTRIEGLEASTARLTAKLQEAGADSNRIRNQLTNSHIEIEELHAHITKLKEQLIGTNRSAGTHINNNDASKLADAEQTIKSLEEEIELYKISQSELEQKLLTLNKKLQAADDELHANVRTFEQLVEQAEKTFRNKIEKMQREHAQDKDQLVRNHQNTIGMFNKQKDEEIAQISKTMQMRVEALEKRYKDMAAAEFSDKSQLENSFKLSQSECARLNEKLIQLQMGYINAVNDKEQLTNAKREAEKKIKAMELELQVVKNESSKKDTQLRDLSAKNMELVVQMTSK